MKNNIIITVILVIVLIGAAMFLLPKGKNGSLASPMGNFLNNPTPSPVVVNYNPPKEIEYDKNTDLNKELDNVNPKVLDADFDNLKNL